MRMLLINLISEEIFYYLTTEFKNAKTIEDTFHFCFNAILKETFESFGGVRAELNDLEKRLIKDEVRRRIFGEDC